VTELVLWSGGGAEGMAVDDLMFGCWLTGEGGLLQQLPKRVSSRWTAR